MSRLSCPIVALVGRPNVGKSTLFNRLIGSRKAVISTLRGTTRDRLYATCEWHGTRFTVIDTGGVEFETEGSLAAAVQRHVQQAVREDREPIVNGEEAINSLAPVLAAVISAREGRRVWLDELL